MSHSATFVQCHTHTANRSILGFLSPLQCHTVRHLYTVTLTQLTDLSWASSLHCNVRPCDICRMSHTSTHTHIPCNNCTMSHTCRYRHIRIKCYVRDDVVRLLVQIVSSSQRHWTTNLRVKEPQHCTECLPCHM